MAKFSQIQKALMADAFQTKEDTTDWVVCGHWGLETVHANDASDSENVRSFTEGQLQDAKFFIFTQVEF